MRLLVLLFVLMPIVEMTLLIKVGAAIGALNTVALVLLTAVIGAFLLRQQGFRTLLNANLKVQAGQIPITEISEGLMLAVAGALLLTPGFVTDVIGFALLTPGLRQQIAKRIAEKLLAGSRSSVQSSFYYESRRDDHIINGEFHEVDETNKRIDR